MILHETVRIQSPGEEIANSVSHGLGLIAAIIAGPILILEALRLARPAFVVGVSVFLATLILLYLSSTLYHALPPGKAKQTFRIIEHAAIFLLIAGTYTPFTLGVLRGPWGWTIFGIVWALAAAGIGLKLLGRVRHPVLSSAIYISMGWVILIALRPMARLMPPQGLMLLALGGLSYTLGIVFFAMHRIRYGHFIWHLFVLVGSGFHVLTIFWYGG